MRRCRPVGASEIASQVTPRLRRAATTADSQKRMFISTSPNPQGPDLDGLFPYVPPFCHLRLVQLASELVVADSKTARQPQRIGIGAIHRSHQVRRCPALDQITELYSKSWLQEIGTINGETRIL